MLSELILLVGIDRKNQVVLKLANTVRFDTFWKLHREGGGFKAGL